MSMFEAQNLEHEIRKDSIAPALTTVDGNVVPRDGVIPLRPEQHSSTTKLTSLQVIARDSTKLTWREAEAMAKGIEAKQKEGATLVQAMQSGAWDWKTFKEEEQPGS